MTTLPHIPSVEPKGHWSPGSTRFGDLGRSPNALSGLTIVLPCFNEAENIADAIRYATAAGERCAAEPSDDEALGVGDEARVPAGGTHSLGVADVLELGRTLGILPQRLFVVGVEADSFEHDAELSPTTAS